MDEKAKQEFSAKVMERVQKTKLSYMECVLELSEEMGLEPTAAGKLLIPPIVKEIEAEAKNLNLLKKSKYKPLPFD